MTPILGIMASQISGHLYAPTGSMFHIASTTLSTTATDVTFGSIPADYTHLQIRYITYAGNGGYLSMQFNADTASNYRWHYLNGNGATASAGDGGADTRIAMPRGAGVANMFGAGVIDILDYANTNKYKTARGIGGRDTNNSDGNLDFNSGLWRNTNAITSIKLYHAGVDLQAYASYALYGVK